MVIYIKKTLVKFMKVLITYFSESGNTEKIAKGIESSIGAGDATLFKIEKDTFPTDLKSYDVAFIGAPVNANGIPKPVKNFLETIPEGMKTALFFTHGMPTENLWNSAKKKSEKLIDKKNGEILGVFDCLGVHSEKVRKMMPQNLLDIGKEAAGHPDDTDLKNAAGFAEEILVKLA